MRKSLFTVSALCFLLMAGTAMATNYDQQGNYDQGNWSGTYSTDGTKPLEMNRDTMRKPMEKLTGSSTREQKTDAFNILDGNQNGKLSVGEFTEMDPSLERPDLAFKQIDTNKDGMLDRDEFLNHNFGSKY